MWASGNYTQHSHRDNIGRIGITQLLRYISGHMCYEYINFIIAPYLALGEAEIIHAL